MSETSHWSAKYIGLPYVMADCAQLCVKVQREIFNREIKLPVARATGSFGLSQQIEKLQDNYAQLINNPVEGDAVLMRGKGRLNHIGTLCIINNRHWVLHAAKNSGATVLHDINVLNNLGLEISGYYRWLT